MPLLILVVGGGLLLVGTDKAVPKIKHFSQKVVKVFKKGLL